MTPFKTHPLLDSGAISHGFFGRKGGVSNGQFESLNTGQGSKDTPENVFENRRRVAETIGTIEPRLLSNYQVHSAEVLIVDGPWGSKRPEADGLVTKTPGLALSALGRAMESIGASRESITAVLGPCISQPNYEVGHDFRDSFVAENESYDRFFKLGPPKEAGERRPHFDLKRFILARLREQGVTRIDCLADCTYGKQADYFSYRYNTRQGTQGYGRNISVIMLKE